ncbi:TetR/AcrR family transcriptional regulator [Amycolatopsis sp. SID8362]|uniref:TetR/AcrR family transcriptional regulator n=1 Tax=Amycolatopsis sp. SID8362 TaxID=2690346 RepID=UPI001369D39D|nr:TetR/AcrR family transcriptional regulator [Amycolatopsis sp. SID8362]NBH03187.1 TetR family transcriptional regulator [Amycolatopsis sp. SID8362]NED39888.1 TetR/AcrR family transcriptional regulator [Amycolatopsis sp. SID8362]
MRDTRERILDVALEVLGKNPEAGMGAIASAAGVVRRTVYGHFPSRTDLVLALTRRAVSEIAAVLAETAAAHEAADEAWAAFIARLWPLTDRYRVLVVLRRGEYGEEIHSLLGPVEKTLADLVKRGQDGELFGHHLPADVLSAVAFAAVFAIADNDLARGTLGVRAATMTSLLTLGVPEARAKSLLEGRP